MIDFMEMQVWLASWHFFILVLNIGATIPWGEGKNYPLSWFGAQAHLESVAVFVSSDCWRWLGSRKKRQICARCQAAPPLYWSRKKKLHENLTNTAAKLLKKLQKKIWVWRNFCKTSHWPAVNEMMYSLFVYCHFLGGQPICYVSWEVHYMCDK